MDHNIHEMHTYNGNIYHVTECKTFIMSSCTNCVTKVLHSINTSILYKKKVSLCVNAKPRSTIILLGLHFITIFQR